MVYEDIAVNKRNTFFLVFFFMLLIMPLGYILGELYGNYYIGLIIAFSVSAISVYTSYFHSDTIIAAATGAKKANPVIYKPLYNAVENMSLAAGIKMPKVYIMEKNNINAFATGRDPNHALIALTSGAVKKLNKQELEGVVAHEMSHIKNYDILVGSVSAVLVGTIVMISDLIARNIFYGRRGRRSSGNGGVALIIIGLAAAILAPMVSKIISLAVSRQREYLADANAVLLTRYPKGLINALEKIKKENYPVKDVNRGVQHLYFTTPSYLKSNALFETHPPIYKRIERLQKNISGKNVKKVEGR